MKRNSFCVLFFFLSILYACNLVKYKKGESLFLTHCAQCHMDDGSGVESLYPSLVKSEVNSLEIPCIIVNGINREESLLEMVGIKGLSDVEVSNITNYVVHDLQKRNKELSINQINEILEDCKQIQ